jgi:hypothetical protein
MTQALLKTKFSFHVVRDLFVRHRKYQVSLLVFLIFIFTISLMLWWMNRGDWIFPEQVYATEVVDIADHLVVGQSFVARLSGLEGLEIKIAQDQVEDLNLILYLRSSSESAESLRLSSVLVSSLRSGDWVRFPFEPLSNSQDQLYYFVVESAANVPVSFYKGPANVYYEGTLYQNGIPQDAQIVFRTLYSRHFLALGIIQEVVVLFLIGLVLLLVFLLPGWSIVVWFDVGSERHWIEQLGVAAGVGLAIYPVLLLWGALVNINPGGVYVWGLLFLSIVVLVYYYRSRRVSFQHVGSIFHSWFNSSALWTDLTLIGLLLIAGLSRLFMVRDLTLPLWDDSVQHLVILKRILESGGLFHSWHPYAPYDTFSLHFGFHADIAAMVWVSGIDPAQAILWGGQIINLLAVLTLAPLAYRIGGIWAVIITLLVVGMFTQFPAFYTNWGRYPQMSSQAILPVAVWWLWIVLTQEKLKARKLVFAVLVGGMVAAGMTLSYYRMAFHYLTFTLAVAAVLLSASKLRQWQYWIAPTAIAAVTLLLVGPWIANFSSRPEIAPVMIGSRDAPATFWQGFQQMQINWTGPEALTILLGTLMAIWRGKAAALPVVWLWILVLLPAMRTLPLPGVEIIQEFTIDTSLYIVTGLIWGAVVGTLIHHLTVRRQLFTAIAASVVIFVALIRVPPMLTMIDRDFDLSTRPDIEAAKWMQVHLPADAVVLINGIVYTDGITAIGGDAGFWLPVLSGHRVTIPPQYALVIEQPTIAGYNEAVGSLVRQLFETSASSKEGKAAICNFPEEITHVYIGQRRGMVDKPLPVPPPHPMLQADLLLEDPSFQLLYQKDHAMVFGFDRSICTTF